MLSAKHFFLIQTETLPGVPTVVDATNLHRKDRLAFVDLAPETLRVRYHIIDRPMSDKIVSGGWRNAVKVKDDKPLMQKHAETFGSQLRDILSGDGRANVEVIDARANLTAQSA